MCSGDKDCDFHTILWLRDSKETQRLCQPRIKQIAEVVTHSSSNGCLDATKGILPRTPSQGGVLGLPTTSHTSVAEGCL